MIDTILIKDDERIWPRDTILIKDGDDKYGHRDTILIKGDANMAKRYYPR